MRHPVCGPVIALLIMFAWITAALAEEVSFYEKYTDKFWTVYGGANTETGQATCCGSAKKKDGSFIQIHRSLVDGELWAIIRNVGWEIEGEGKGTARWNFFREGKDAFVDGTDFTYEVKNKNTILILDINSKRFAEVLWKPVLHLGHAGKPAEHVCQLREARLIDARSLVGVRHPQREKI